ncbi:thyroid receptor-interacting protein 11-like isoform X2 [Dendronephthya gigantea]|uniref:thyroid receptor-interacting protein 11-like isoform X2 n=1 Tax=Dendronephthya gigantea TaxID=151771 RepID=UPI001069A103|nr:thyroid receptor-interacting protein 11-like isoform X2 [Dendronephthya gigantea]
MSWLSTSFSENLTNITGQISTFTKDMLTEGTVEVEDHETELKIVKSRVRELELTLFTQREEYDRVKELNHELEERAEATELQISSISREYRVLLQEKENENAQLREQLETWKEHGSKQPHERLPSFNEDSFVESTSQDEVQYLKSLVNKLQEEKQQWSKQNESENLHKELDHYQHELATLHTTYSQRIATLNKKHKQEIEELESFHQEDSIRIQELEQQLVKFEKNVEKTEDIVLESESDFEIIKKESTESDLHALSNEQSSSSVTELKIIIDRLQSENNELKEKVDQFVLEATQKDSEISSLRQENSDLSEKLNKAQKLESQGLQTSDSGSELAHLQQEIRELTEQRDQAVVSEAQTSASLESLREELSRLGAVTMELMKEVEQSQGVDKEKSIEIESLKKLCQVRRASEGEGSVDEVMKLKDMLAVLWQKYSSVVLENEKGDTKSLLNGLSEARTKLTNQIEGQQEENTMEKDQLISMMPGVENDIEDHEESLSRLSQQHNENKVATREIVNDFGRRWSVSNHVASLQSEKAVLERTIVGLEEKVQELEKRLECSDTSRSSVSTVVSVDSIRAAPDLQEDDGVLTSTPPESAEYGVLTQNTGESRENTREDDDSNHNEGYDNCSNEGSNEVANKDYNMLMDKLREYEEMIQEFELIKDDWEGEKEALENVVVQLRQKLKEATSAGQISREKEIRYINDIEELLVKKNYVSDEELRMAENSREDLVLSYVLDWLKKDKNHQEMIVEARDANQCYMSPGTGNDPFQNELGIVSEENAKDCEVMKKPLPDDITIDQSDSLNELHATKTELSTARDELDQTNAKLNETLSNLDKTRIENERLDVEVGEATEKMLDLQSKLKMLKDDLENSEMNFNLTISEKDKEIHKLRNTVEQLQEALSNFENDKGTIVLQLRNKIENLQKELDEVMLSRETMATQLQESKQEVTLILESRNSLNTQLSEMVREKERLLEMVNDRDARIEELQDAYDSVDQRITFLQDEGKGKSEAFSELSEENSLLKEEKSDLFSLLETKDIDLSNSLRETEKLSELLREQELASEEMKRQNSELAQELENWRVQLDHIKQTKETLNKELDAKSEEIMSLKENNIELSNQSYENNAEISQKLSMLEELVSENSSLKSKNETLIEALSEKRISEKEMMDSYNLLVREKEQLDASFSTKSAEMDVEIRRKIDEVEVLRLEVARLTKQSQEKDHVIRTQVSANLVSGSDNDVIPKQEHIRRILQEKDVEIDALRTKNESLLTLFAENEDEKRRSGEEREKQITSMLEREARMFNEINEKNDQIIALEDRLEMLNIKSASKDQASALIHAEHQKLLHLNESQSEEIGRLREKVATLGLLVAERDHSVSSEVQRLRQRNSDLQSQVDALQGEQERLLGLVHDKDKQLLRHETPNIVQETPIGKSQQVVVNAMPSQDLNNHLSSFTQETLVGRSPEVLGSGFSHANLSQNQDEVRRLFEENQKLSKETTTLRNSIASLNDSVKTERKNKASLVQENNVVNQRLQAFQATKMEDDKHLRRLQLEGEKLREELSAKERQILAEKEENNRRIYEINTLRNEKEELLLEQSSQVEGLQSKLSSLLDVISSDVDLKDEQFEILENREDFEKLVTRVKSHRAKLLSDKENEVRCLKEQVETLSSVQNISNPQLEAKLEQFMHEKDVMNQRMVEVENEKIELLELKENEMTSLQTQVVDLSNILKQKERKWLAERDAFSEKNKLLEKRYQILEQERDSLVEMKVKSENEISILRDEVTTLTSSADEKLDVVLHEKDRRIKDLERELEHLNHRCSQSLKEAQDMKNELETSKQLTQEFEMKKEKELERLRTHLLQVEDSYTQEALASEERENELRNQLEQIQQQLLTSSHSLQDSNRTASMRMENLQEQLINITAHRDEVQALLEQSQEQSLQYMRSVENLQMVLEQFQREKESELRNLHEKNREQLNEVRKEETRLREREHELQQLLENASDTLNKAERMSQDLKIKEDEIESLKLTIGNLELDLQSSHDKLRKLTSNSDNRIEKGLMKNMLLAYFNTSEHKRCEVVGILGHILNFTEEEIKKVGTGSHPLQSTGWFSGLLSYSGSNQSQQHDKSFSELFVSFLEKESENQLMSQSELQPPSSGTRPSPAETRPTKSVTAIPARLRDSPLPISPLASSTPLGNTRSVTPSSKPVVTNPLLMNAGKEGDAGGANGTGTVDNALLGSSLRASLDLPKISTSSSTALRQILFNN